MTVVAQQNLYPSWSQPPINAVKNPPAQPILSGRQDAFQRSALSLDDNPAMRKKMYRALQKALGVDVRGQLQLHRLQEKGILDDRQAEDGRSTLYHLYHLYSTPRANTNDNAYNNQHLLKETIDFLDRPQAVTQKFGALTPVEAQQIVSWENTHPPQTTSGAPIPFNPVTANDLMVKNSATCVSSSVMYCMAATQPSEFCRQIDGLTGPGNAFYKTVPLNEISPKNPSQAISILQQAHIPFMPSQKPGQIVVKVSNPPTGILRAMDSQKDFSRGHTQRNGIETAYQSALTHLVASNYDPATDRRVGDSASSGNPGLTESEKTLMETIIRGNGGIESVTYQAVSGKTNPRPGEENQSYLYGYNRTFQQTEQDILTSLSNNKPVIVGITDTAPNGQIVNGHELTIRDAYFDTRKKQLMFRVNDSDDAKPRLISISAATLIPRIHHAGLPLNLASSIHQQQYKNAYYLPDRQDASKFHLLAMTPPTQVILPSDNSAA